MKIHNRRFSGFWMLVSLGIVLVAVHFVPLYYLFSHTVVSATIAAGVLSLLLIKHLGCFVPLATFFRRRRRRS